MKENTEPKYRIGAISDTQEREGDDLVKALGPLRRLEDSGVKLDLITHIGDLAGTGIFSQYIKETKQLMSRYDVEKQEGELSAEASEYESTVTSPEYVAFAERMRGKGAEQDVGIYALWTAQQRGEFERVLEEMEPLIRHVTEQLGEFRTDVQHVMGNADRPFPEKLAAVQRLLQEQNITSYDQPAHVSLDEKTSLLFWPSLPKGSGKEQAMQLMEQVDSLAEEMQDKASVLVFAHETPFKGPQKPSVYSERVAEAGIEGGERLPYKQFSKESKYLLELLRRLPADTKIAVACGHMHVPRETIEAGTKYLKFDETGKAEMRLFGAGEDIDRDKYEIVSGGKRTFDLYYLPEGEVGTFEIREDGSIGYQKLSEDK